MEEKGPRVLIAHRDECVVDVFKKILMRKGFEEDELITCVNGKEILDLISQNNIAVVMSGTNYPHFSRKLEIVQFIQNHKRRHSFIFIVHSGAMMANDCFKLGVDAYIAHPVGLEELCKKLSIIVRKKLELSLANPERQFENQEIFEKMIKRLS